MTIEQLRRAFQERPFRAFSLMLDDGREIRVPHPDFMMIPPRAERTFAVADNDGIIETFDLLHVVSIRPWNGRPGGQQRRSRR